MEPSRIIAAFRIIDNLLPAMGHRVASQSEHQNDPQTKTPSSAIHTLAIVAAMDFGGNHRKTLAFAKDLRFFSYLPSPSYVW